MRKRWIEKRVLIGLLLALSLFSFLVSASFADIPGKINYQGYLTDSGGTPINGNVQMVFSIYDSPSGGVPLWTEPKTVTVTNGLYTANLGDDPNPITLAFDIPYYLGVKVGSDPEMTPRKPLTSVPYAFRANYVENDQDTTYSAGMGLILRETEFSVDSTVIQKKVTGTCPPGSSIREIREDGTVVCESAGTGDITAVTASGGLTGGGTAGDVTLSIAPGGVTNDHIADAVGFVSVQNSGGAEQFKVTDGAQGLRFEGAGAASVSFDPATHRITITSSGTSSGGDITGVAAGTGLTGGGTSGDVTLNVQVPLSLYGSSSAAIVDGINSGAGNGMFGFAGDTSAVGVYGFAAGLSGRGVVGYGANTGDGTNYGGYFQASGSSGRGVYGEATNAGDVFNYGGHFQAAGTYATGVFGRAEGSHGSGVYGYGANAGDVTNYGGYFQADGASGRGVLGYAGGSSGTGVYGDASGISGKGVFGKATGSNGIGGYFESTGTYGTGAYSSASGDSGQGVYGYSSGSSGTGVYGRASGSSGRGVYGQGGEYGIYGSANGELGVGVYGHGGNAAVTNYGGYFVATAQYGNAVYGHASGSRGNAIVGIASGQYSRGVYAQAYGGPNTIGIEGSGNQYDFYASGPGANYAPFTGSHEVKLSDQLLETIKPGMIVSVTGKTQVRRRNDGTISLSSTLPTVDLSRVANDKAVFGALVAEAPLPHDHWYEGKHTGRFGVVNALGEGRVLVSNANADIEAGDYITTSAIPGYGQKQNDDILRSYTLGKAIETVDWDSVTETVEFNGKTYKIYLIAVVYTSG